MRLKGKQIKDSSVEQAKLNVTTESITNISSVTNAEYVNTNSVDRVESITYATLNMDMTANNATIGGKSCETPIIQFPISSIQVKVNNVNVTVGETADCYFSPDGSTIRTGGQAEKGDYLYWNSTRFDLDDTDEIDFVYLVSSETVELAAGSTQVIDPYYPALNIKYVGVDNTNMTLTIDGVDFITGNVAGDFVWDIGGANETTMTIKGESILQDVNGENYTIWFDGFGSLLFSIKKGDFVLVIVIPDFGDGLFNLDNGRNIFSVSDYTHIGYIIENDDKFVVLGGFNTYGDKTSNYIMRFNSDGTYDNSFNVGIGLDFQASEILLDSNNKYVIVGSFDKYHNNIVNGIVRLNYDGSIDNTFVTGDGFGNILSYDSHVFEYNNKYIVFNGASSYDSNVINGIVRLNQDGSIDNTFTSGFDMSNPVSNFKISEVILDDDKYVIIGSFDGYDGNVVNGIVRINQDGSIDIVFNQGTGTGFNSYVLDIVNVPNIDGYVISTMSTSYNGNSINRLLFINKSGLLLGTFTVSGTIDGILLDSNNKLLLVGRFSNYNGTSTENIIRINDDGSVDNTFDITNNTLTVNNDYSSASPIEYKNHYIIIGSGIDKYNDKQVRGIVTIKNNGNPFNDDIRPPRFDIRMTVSGGVFGDFSQGVYILNATSFDYPNFGAETWNYTNTLKNTTGVSTTRDGGMVNKYTYKYTKVQLNRDSNSSRSTMSNTTSGGEYTYSYYNTVLTLLNKIYFYSSNAHISSTVTDTSFTVAKGFLSITPFKTYDMGNGTTVTIEQILL